MKRMICVMMALCIAALAGCSDLGANNQQAYCYVRSVYADGFVTTIEEVGDVFVHLPDADQSFEMFDTVVITYCMEDLRAETGSLPFLEDDAISYGYVLSQVFHARLADPSKGEPTFG